MRALVAGPPTLAALAAALDGTGPALLTSDEPRVVAALRPQDGVDPDVAVVVPTSGSTGAPKGVLLTAGALLAVATAALERLGGPGRWLLAVPPTHVGGLQVLVRSLVAGLDPVVAPPGPFGPSSLDGSAGCRYVSLVPTQLRRLAPADLAGFDAALLGGAATPARLRARFPNVVTTYGMSETGGGCVYDGVPLAGVEVSLGQVPGDGVPGGGVPGGGVPGGGVPGGGRLRLRGPGLGLGYRDGAPLRDPDGWFTTGDVGSLADGRVVVHGRADDVVNTGGEKVAPAAVEEALAAHPGVREVVVAGLPDPEWGQRVVAWVVGSVTLEEARAWVAERVGRAAAPREVRHVEALPLLANGKIDRGSLTS